MYLCRVCIYVYVGFVAASVAAVAGGGVGSTDVTGTAGIIGAGTSGVGVVEVCIPIFTIAEIPPAVSAGVVVVITATAGIVPLSLAPELTDSEVTPPAGASATAMTVAATSELLLCDI